MTIPSKAFFSQFLCDCDVTSPAYVIISGMIITSFATDTEQYLRLHGCEALFIVFGDFLAPGTIELIGRNGAEVGFELEACVDALIAKGTNCGTWNVTISRLRCEVISPIDWEYRFEILNESNFKQVAAPDRPVSLRLTETYSPNVHPFWICVQQDNLKTRMFKTLSFRL